MRCSIFSRAPGLVSGRRRRTEKMSREEIVQAFALEKISPKAAVFDEKKLDWMNGKYLAEMKRLKSW